MLKKLLYTLYLIIKQKISDYEISLLYENKSLSINKGVVFNDKPIINICESARCILEENVIIDSSNNGYHLNMFNPVKILLDRPNALLKIGKSSRIHGSCIHATKEIIIGERCLIAANCQIIDNNGHDQCFEDVEERINSYGTSKSIMIEDDVWISTNCVILPGVIIGKGSIIGANSVVSKSIPPFSLANGIPAVVIKQHKTN
nr:acyltransferase [uncultured Carboxylicivirga sp.]